MSKQPFDVQEVYREKGIPAMDKIITATCEADLERIAKELGWPVEAVVTAWTLWKMSAF